MRNIQFDRRLAQWDVQTIIAMFCSGVDRHHTFDTGAKETRVRLLVNLEDFVNNRYNDVQVAYTLACMEYQGVGNHIDPARPTHSVRRFAQLLRRDESLFVIENNNNFKQLGRNITKRLTRARLSDQWSEVDPEVHQVLNFLYAKKNDLLKPSEPKRRPHKSSAKKLLETKPVELVPAVDGEDEFGYGYNVVSSTPASTAFMTTATTKHPRTEKRSAQNGKKSSASLTSKPANLVPALDGKTAFGYGYYFDVAPCTASGTAFAQQTTATPKSHATSDPVVSVPYNKSRIDAHLHNNPLLTALVQPVLGAVLKGDTMEFSWSNNVAKFRKIDNATLPRSWKIKTANDISPEPSLDEEIASFVAAGDLKRLIEYRDRDYNEAEDDDV
jgi:hypothetical protein